MGSISLFRRSIRSYQIEFRKKTYFYLPTSTSFYKKSSLSTSYIQSIWLYAQLDACSKFVLICWCYIPIIKLFPKLQPYKKNRFLGYRLISYWRRFSYYSKSYMENSRISYMRSNLCTIQPVEFGNRSRILCWFIGKILASLKTCPRIGGYSIHN